MKEKIGQVTLDDTYYPGQDLYSDGEIEDEMLEIAKTYSQDQWNEVIAQRKSWPILYHFSHVRENILSWLPLPAKKACWKSAPAAEPLQAPFAKRQSR